MDQDRKRIAVGEDSMRIGKLSNQELEEIVLSKLPPLSSKTITGAGIGADCAWLDFGDNTLVTSTDPVTAGGMQSGRIAIHVSCNDIAACGVKPIGILLVLIAPPDTTREELALIVEQASATAAEVGVDIVGGHTEISDSVNRFVVTTTAFGTVGKTDCVPLGHALPGDTLLMTKTAAIEGSWIAAMEYETLLKKDLTGEQLEEVRNYITQMSVVKDGVCAASCVSSAGGRNSKGNRMSAAHLMHDITEGGVYGAAFEMADLSGTGLVIDTDTVPVTSLTRKICGVLDLDVYRLISSGSILIASDEPDVIINRLAAEGIPCTAIGTFTESGFFVRDKKGQLSVLEPPETDELYKLNNRSSTLPR